MGCSISVLQKKLPPKSAQSASTLQPQVRSSRQTCRLASYSVFKIRAILPTTDYCTGKKSPQFLPPFPPQPGQQPSFVPHASASPAQKKQVVWGKLSGKSHLWSKLSHSRSACKNICHSPVKDFHTAHLTDWLLADVGVRVADHRAGTVGVLVTPWQALVSAGTC